MPRLEETTLGRYCLLRKLADGGMSEVYLAHDQLMNREVAIKVVNSYSTDYLERFQREAEVLGKLNHDHILPAFDYGIQEPWHYLVIPYLSYGTLYKLLREGPLPPKQAGKILDQIASALQYAHDHGILHRDIKPSNILLRDRDYIYLADFGLAKSVEGGNTITQTGTLLGTPEYMAPDLADGPATTSSDIYALGILLYQMVTGHVPFTAETPTAIYWKQIRDQPTPPSHLNSALSPAIDRVILQALEKDSHRRFPTAQAVADAYRDALSLDEMNNWPTVSHSDETLQSTNAYNTSNESVTPHLTARSKKRHPKSLRTLALSIIALGLLIFIALPMSYVYYMYYQYNSQTAATTQGPTEIINPNPTQQIQASTPIDTSETPILLDSLAHNTDHRWAEDAIDCVFTGNAYHVAVHTSNYLQSCPLSLPIDDMAVQVDVNLLSGNNAGMLLRLKGETFYDFEIDNHSRFFFRRHDTNAGLSYQNLISPTASSAIAPLGQKNTLLAIAQKDDFKLYINGTFVAEVHDKTYANGEMALTLGTLSPITTGDGSFTDFKLFKVN